MASDNTHHILLSLSNRKFITNEIKYRICAMLCSLIPNKTLLLIWNFGRLCYTQCLGDSHCITFQLNYILPILITFLFPARHTFKITIFFIVWSAFNIDFWKLVLQRILRGQVNISQTANDFITCINAQKVNCCTAT